MTRLKKRDKIFSVVTRMVGMAQLVRALGCGPGDRGFKSHYSPHGDSFEKANPFFHWPIGAARQSAAMPAGRPTRAVSSRSCRGEVLKGFGANPPENEEARSRKTKLSGFSDGPKAVKARGEPGSSRLRPLTKPATAKMPAEIMKSAGIFAYRVSCCCKFRSLTSV